MARAALLLLALIAALPLEAAPKRKKKKPKDEYAASKYKARAMERHSYRFSAGEARSYTIPAEDDGSSRGKRKGKGKRGRHDPEHRYLAPAQGLPRAYKFDEEGRPIAKEGVAEAKPSSGGQSAAARRPVRKLEPVSGRSFAAGAAPGAAAGGAPADAGPPPGPVGSPSGFPGPSAPPNNDADAPSSEPAMAPGQQAEGSADE